MESKVLPSHLYGDPAVVIERAEMRALGCRGCQQGFIAHGRVVCTEPRNERQKGVPHAGDRCRYFILKG